MNESTVKVGYVLKRFPRFSETFILNEILELERQGVEVEVFSLMRPPMEPRHPMLAELRARVTYLPGGSAMGKWKVYSGIDEVEREKRPVPELFYDRLPFAELFPGKTASEASHLCLQATTVAMLAHAGNIQHLHAHFCSNATTVVMLAGRMSRLPYSFTAHARDIYHTYIDPVTDDTLRARKMESARFVVTVSDFNQKHLTGLVAHANSHRIRRLYNGIDIHHFVPQQELRDHQHLIAVGRLVEKKGFPYLIEACRLLKQRGIRFSCEIIGDGPDRDALVAQVENAGLSKQVKLAGSLTQNRLIQRMAGAGIVVLPCIVGESGDRDGLPTVLLEGMAMGLPSVSTNVAGVPEIIEHKKTGFVTPERNAEELSFALQILLENRELARQFGASGRIKAEKLFNLKRNVAQLRGWFEQSAAGISFDHEGDDYAHRIRYS